MKKIYILGIVSVLALSLFLTGCGGTQKSENSNRSGTQSQDMNSNSGDMKNMDHSKMNMDGNKKQ